MEPIQQLLEGNTQKPACGAVVQETKLDGDNAEDVDEDLQREPIRLMHNMPKPSAFAFSGRPSR